MNSEFANGRATANLRLIPLIRILTKRGYLPLIAIYFVNVSGLSLGEVGIVGAFVALVKVASEVPTGYFSDEFSRKYSIVLAGVLAVIGNLVFIFFQNFAGVFIGTFFETMAYAFLSGTVQALAHDSLTVLGRENEYSKYSSRVQSISLVANAVLVAVTPLTYAIDARLPFVIGIAQFSLLTFAGFYLHDVRHFKAHDIIKKINMQWVKRHKPFMLFAFVFGLFSAIYIAPKDFTNLAFEAFGANPSYLGFVYAGASLIGAFIGLFAHKLKDLGPAKFSILDVLVVTAGFTSFASGNLIIAITALVLRVGFWRYRAIIYQDFILEKYQTDYKATLLSITFNTTQFFNIFLPLGMGALVAMFGLQSSFLIYGICVAFTGLPFVLIVRKVLAR